jgi:hypothetical protein
MTHQAFELECEVRSEQELMFFRVHGYWPEAAAVSGREEHSFTVHGLRTTVILERVQHPDEDELGWYTWKNIESISVDEIAYRTPDESAFILLHGCRPEQTKLTERTMRSFTTHSLKTTIILEPDGVQRRVVK